MQKQWWAEKKAGRWQARYLAADGAKRSAGVYSNKHEAEAAAEHRFKLGENGNLLDMSLEQYSLYWRDSSMGSDSTGSRTKYGHYGRLEMYVFPRWGKVKVREVNRRLIVEIVNSVLEDPRAKATSQTAVRNALGSLFKPLVEMEIIDSHPVRDIKVKPVVEKITVLPEPEEFREIVEAMPGPAKHVARFAIWTGMRTSEMFALLVGDVVFDRSGIATVHQREKMVRNVKPGEPTWGRVEGSKRGTQRSIPLSKKQSADLRLYLEENDLWGQKDRPLFPRSVISPVKRQRIDLDDWDPNGDYGTFIDDHGIERRHGTTTGYANQCRCRECKNAQTLWSREYRLRRREGKKMKRKRSVTVASSTDFMNYEVWYKVWRKAIAEADVEWQGKAYLTRSMCATWLLDAGKSVTEVQQLLGHKNKLTTLGYERLSKKRLAETTSALDDVV